MLRLALTPRWMLWHVITLGAMITCGWLAAWQWGRAGSAMGSALNVGYGLQWPVFAVFFGVMWWRFLRMEATNVLAGSATAAAEPAAVESAPAASAVEEPAAPEPRVELAADRPEGAVPRHAEPAFAGPSPFTSRSRGGAAPAPVLEGSRLAEYNRMLAELAARESQD